MDNNAYFVSPFPSRPKSHWKLEIPSSFAGKKVRRFFSSELAAWEEGEHLTGQIRERGTKSLEVDGVTVAVAVRRFQSGRSEHGQHMTNYLRLFVEKYGPLGLSSIGPAELERFWTRSQWPDGKATRRQAFAYLRILFNSLERYDLIERNPIRRVTPPKTPAPLRNILLPAEMVALLKKATNDQAHSCAWERLLDCARRKSSGSSRKIWTGRRRRSMWLAGKPERDPSKWTPLLCGTARGNGQLRT